MSLWLIGAIDPSGGAGLLRDAWAAARVAPSLRAHAVVTAFTDQGRGRPARAFAVTPARVRQCIERLPAPRAVKLGLVPDSLVPSLAALLEPLHVPIVMDPVMVASDGGHLGASPRSLRVLARGATLVTPNVAEARALADEAEALPSASRLRAQLGVPVVLLKSVPSTGSSRVRDVLADEAGEQAFDRPRVAGPDPRGTGCALATAIACGLAAGVGVREAVQRAIAWLDVARAQTTPGPDGRAHLS